MDILFNLVLALLFIGVVAIFVVFKFDKFMSIKEMMNIKKKMDSKGR